jgi:hypothetical protein
MISPSSSSPSDNPTYLLTAILFFSSISKSQNTMGALKPLLTSPCQGRNDLCPHDKGFTLPFGPENLRVEGKGFTLHFVLRLSVEGKGI